MDIPTRIDLARPINGVKRAVLREVSTSATGVEAMYEIIGGELRLWRPVRGALDSFIETMDRFAAELGVALCRRIETAGPYSGPGSLAITFGLDGAS